jgi:hypothetical protein
MIYVDTWRYRVGLADSVDDIRRRGDSIGHVLMWNSQFIFIFILYIVYIFVHNTDQMYIPQKTRLYRSDFKEIILENSEGYYSADISLSKKHWKALDQKNDRCDVKSINPVTSVCISDFIQSSVECSASLYGCTSGTAKCTLWTEYVQLDTLSKTIQSSNENEIYNMTGCLSACEKDEYRIDTLTKRKITSDKDQARLENIIELKFLFETGVSFITVFKLDIVCYQYPLYYIL